MRTRAWTGGALVLAGGALMAQAAAPTLREHRLQGLLREALPAGRVVEHAGLRLEPMARILIPRLGMDLVAAGGEANSDEILGSAPLALRPRSQGPLVVSAHRDAQFRPLEHLVLGDGVGLRLPGQSTRHLRVAAIHVVEPSDLSVLETLGPDDLVLSTCHPFRHLGPAPRRFLAVLRAPGEGPMRSMRTTR